MRDGRSVEAAARMEQDESDGIDQIYSWQNEAAVRIHVRTGQDDRHRHRVSNPGGLARPLVRFSLNSNHTQMGPVDHQPCRRRHGICKPLPPHASCPPNQQACIGVDATVCKRPDVLARRRWSVSLRMHVDSRLPPRQPPTSSRTLRISPRAMATTKASHAANGTVPQRVILVTGMYQTYFLLPPQQQEQSRHPGAAGR